MGYRELERLDGVGTIKKEDGTTLVKRRYSLSVWQQMLDVGRGETIPGLRQIRGRVALEGHEGITLILEEALILELEDGRSLPFFFTNSDGQIAARGALQ